LNLQLY